jgi:O-antigen/teichoic acid export membrane protein
VPKIRTTRAWPLVRKATGRMTWGMADQAMSSLGNFAVNIFIARELGLKSYGAFSLAYVTYSFALNASRGLATDPLLVRFSGAEERTWRRAVASCTGTAASVGLASGVGVLLVAAVLHGSVRAAFIALGLTLPALLLQDSWRFSFFAAGRGAQALLNDAIWTVVLIPALAVLKITGHVSVFWFLLAWGLSNAVAALIGPLQARVRPRPLSTLTWIHTHRDLGPRYLLEGTVNSSQTLLRNFTLSFILSLTAVGAIQAANTLMGPFMVVFFGMGLVTLPEAARVLRRSPRHFPMFCALVSAGLGVLAVGWTVVLLVALPRGLGHALLGSGTVWRPTNPLVLPLGIFTICACVSAGAGAGLHALGASKRSLRAMTYSSVLYVVFCIVGARVGGSAVGAMDGAAVSGVCGAVLFWWELRNGFRDYRKGLAANRTRRDLRTGKHRRQFAPPHAVPAAERESA